MLILSGMLSYFKHAAATCPFNRTLALPTFIENPTILIQSGFARKKHIPIHIPFTISKESLTGADIVFVTLQSEDGKTGLGEAAPFPSLTGDTIQEAHDTIESTLPEIMQKTTSEALNFLKKQRQDIRSRSTTAFTALEMAIWDLHGKVVSQSLATLWGNANLTGVETDITMPIMPVGAVAEFWQIFSKYKFPIIKIKVSGHIDADVSMIMALKDIVPSTTRFTLDGNQSYAVDTAIRLVHELKKNHILPIFFEQPLAEDDWLGHKNLSEKMPFPVCLDETVKTADDAKRVVRERTASMINLKLMKSGIAETLEIIEIAAKNNIQLMIGGMLETEIAMGTSLQMACGTGKITYADLDTPFFMKERVAQNSAWHQTHAFLKNPSGYGHGMVI